MNRHQQYGSRKFDSARKRAKIAELYLTGMTQIAISREIKLSRSQVSRHVKAVQAEWMASAIRDLDKAKVIELAKIDRLELLANEAWVKSCKNAEEVRTKSVLISPAPPTAESGSPPATPAPPADPVAVGGIETTKTVKGQCGDPRFLERIGWCIAQRCKILGLEAPTKIEGDGAVLGIVEELIDVNVTVNNVTINNVAVGVADENDPPALDAAGVP